MKSLIFISEILCLEGDLRWEIMVSVIGGCFILQVANPFSDIAAFLCHTEECVVWVKLSKMESSMLMKLGCLPAFFSQKEEEIIKRKRKEFNLSCIWGSRIREQLQMQLSWQVWQTGTHKQLRGSCWWKSSSATFLFL